MVGLHQSVVAAVPGLRTSSLYSDLTLQLGDRKWALHKVIVCPQSKFFANACNGRWEEAQKGLIEIHDDDPDAVHAMVEYLYTGTYHRPSRSKFNVECSMLNVDVFIVADKYEVLDLPGLASGNFFQSVQTEWVSPGFAEVIRVVYEDSPDNVIGKNMRRVVVETCIKHKSSDGTCQVGRTNDIRMSIKDVTLFGIEFHKAALQVATEHHKQKIAGMNANFTKRTCDGCGTDFGMSQRVSLRGVAFCALCGKKEYLPGR